MRIRILVLLWCLLLSIQAQTVIDLHSGRVQQRTESDNPMSKARIQDRDRALQQHNAQAYTEVLARAFSLLRADSLSTAQQALEEALQLCPDAPGNDIVRYNIAKILMVRRQWRDAERRLQEVVARSPRLKEANVAYANCLYELEENRRLITWVDTLLAHTDRLAREDSIPLLLKQSDAYIHLSEPQKAIRPLQLVLTRDRQNEMAHAMMATALYKQGKREQARLYLDAMIRNNEGSKILLVARADIAEQSGDYEVALADLTHLQQLSSNQEIYGLHRFRLLLQLERKKEAKELLDDLHRAGVADEFLIPAYRQLQKQR